MSLIYTAVSSFLSGILGSMGFGGGTILIVYLTVFLGLQQTNAQGINLVFFIPCAIYAVISYVKQGLIDKLLSIKLTLSSLIGVVIGYYLLTLIEPDLLGKIFGGFLILLALKEIFFTKNNNAQKNS
ncbi:MAG: sulfite exporter TauE/SafE family protein [Clostridia bacterium]